jgi:2-polyprenyl-6-hydroxyphenyl methylase/3-demethylubiquinone-9 3-methyltransferase
MEINNDIYNQEAHLWWQEGSTLSSLQALNPGRLTYINKVIEQQTLSWEKLNILDIGCGGGFICEEYAKKGSQVTGVDPSSGSIDTAKNHAKTSHFTIDYQVAEGEKLPFADASFDVVSCFDVLEHVSDLNQVINEVRRVLKPNGIFLYDTINRTWFSWFLMIKIMQDWPTRVLPKNTHVWHMFIKPKELHQCFTQAALTLKHETGFSPAPSLIGFIKSMIARAKGQPPAHWVGLLKISENPIKAAMYLGWATRSESKGIL